MLVESPSKATSRAGESMHNARGAGMRLNLVLKYVSNFLDLVALLDSSATGIASNVTSTVTTVSKPTTSK